MKLLFLCSSSILNK
uniref:Uncharacterized protein n=1 Tax=Anguilla anguilla TaxID=7936 RepID=A0A0E9VEG2_ANGAN